MYGIIFLQRLTTKERQLAVRLATHRPLKKKSDYEVTGENTEKFERLENITFWDRFQIAFQIRYQNEFLPKKPGSIALDFKELN